jgi:hypothetical protein
MVRILVSGQWLLWAHQPEPEDYIRPAIVLAPVARQYPGLRLVWAIATI